MIYLPNLLFGNPYYSSFGNYPGIYGFNPYRRPYWPYRPGWGYGPGGYHQPWGGKKWQQGPGWGANYGGPQGGQGPWDNRTPDFGQTFQTPQWDAGMDSYQSPY